MAAGAASAAGPVPGAAVPLALACAALLSCTGVPPAECAADADCGPVHFCTHGVCHPGTSAFCPKLEPHFSSLQRDLLKVGCGTSDVNCHSDGAAQTYGHLSFQSNARAHLVGQPARNQGGDPSVQALLVRSDGDANVADNFLLQKLTLTQTAGPTGAGMPIAFPGSTCAEAVATISAWIAAGAKDD